MQIARASLFFSFFFFFPFLLLLFLSRLVESRGLYVSILDTTILFNEEIDVNCLFYFYFYFYFSTKVSLVFPKHDLIGWNPITRRMEDLWTSEEQWWIYSIVDARHTLKETWTEDNYRNVVN